MTEHPRDDLAAYALGALDPHERQAVDAHLETCASCRAEVDAYRAALVRYAAAAVVLLAASRVPRSAARPCVSRLVRSPRARRPGPLRLSHRRTIGLRASPAC